MDSAAPTRIRWLLVTCVAIVAAIFYLDRVNVSISGQFIAQTYNLSDVQLGKVFSAFFLGYAFFQIPAGWAVDRLGPRWVLGLGALWWAIFTSLTASLPAGIGKAFPILWTVRFCLGLGESIVFPCSNRWVANWIPTGERGLANGLIFAGLGGGSAFAPPIVRYTLVHFGWRFAFLACGGFGVVAAVVWTWMGRDHPDQHPWMNEAERQRIHQGLPEKGSMNLPKLSWATMLSSHDVWALTVSYFCFGYSPGIYLTWFFIYLTQVRGLNLRTASYYTMLPFLFMSIGSAFGGWISDLMCKSYGRRWGRCGVAAVGLAGSALCLGVALQAETPATASLILATGAGSLCLAQSAYWALSADFGKGSAGSLSGMMNMACQLGIALTAITTPSLAKHFGWPASFGTAAAFCAFGAVLWLVINPDLELKHAEANQS